MKHTLELQKLNHLAPVGARSTDKNRNQHTRTAATTTNPDGSDGEPGSKPNGDGGPVSKPHGDGTTLT